MLITITFNKKEKTMKKTAFDEFVEGQEFHSKLERQYDKEAEAEGSAIKNHRGMAPRNIKKRGRVGTGVYMF